MGAQTHSKARRSPPRSPPVHARSRGSANEHKVTMPWDVLPLVASVVGSRQVGETGGRSYVEYVIRCKRGVSIPTPIPSVVVAADGSPPSLPRISHQETVWQVFKRYSQLLSFKDRLESGGKGVVLRAPFPPKENPLWGLVR